MPEIVVFQALLGALMLAGLLEDNIRTYRWQVHLYSSAFFEWNWLLRDWQVAYRAVAGKNGTQSDPELVAVRRDCCFGMRALLSVLAPMIYRRMRVLFLCAIGICSMNAWVCAADPIVLPAQVEKVVEQRYPRNVEQLRLIQQQVQQVAKLARPATVGVLVGQGAGSGVIVSADGLVLTAGHVIGKANRRATLLLPDGRRLRGRTLGANHEIDAGMVQIENPPADLPFLPIAPMLPKIGEWVVTTGQPGGTLDDRAPPLRLGRVLGVDDDWVCTDCTLVGGDSGGPLVNLRGEVMAVHSSIGPDIVYNFHVPVVEIQKGWQRLLAGEVWGGSDETLVSTTMRPIIGVAGREENGQCLISHVFPSLPADEAGMRSGDVVQSVDGDNVTSFDELSAKVLEKQPGQTMRLQIGRSGATIEVDVVIAGIRRPVPRGDRAESESRERP